MTYKPTQPEDIPLSARQSLREHSGILVQHGSAPFKHDPKEKQSYFVTLQTPHGPQTIWGVDLRRAVTAAATSPGDQITLQFKGAVPVTVNRPIRDASGRITGIEEVVTKRNAWMVADANGLDLSTSIFGDVEGEYGSKDALSRVQTHVPPRMPSFTESFMMGARGMSGLGSMLSTGAPSINAALGHYGFMRQERELHQVLGIAAGAMDSYQRVDSGSYDPSQLAAAPASLPASAKSPGAKLLVRDLTSAIDRARVLSESLIERGSHLGYGEGELVSKAIDPIQSFLSEHQQALRNIDLNGESAYDRFDRTVGDLLGRLKALLDSIMDAFNGAKDLKHAPSG